MANPASGRKPNSHRWASRNSPTQSKESKKRADAEPERSPMLAPMAIQKSRCFSKIFGEEI
jgi:hypothetical protein